MEELQFEHQLIYTASGADASTRRRKNIGRKSLGSLAIGTTMLVAAGCGSPAKASPDIIITVPPTAEPPAASTGSSAPTTPESTTQAPSSEKFSRATFPFITPEGTFVGKDAYVKSLEIPVAKISGENGKELLAAFQKEMNESSCAGNNPQTGTKYKDYKSAPIASGPAEGMVSTGNEGIANDYYLPAIEAALSTPTSDSFNNMMQNYVDTCYSLQAQKDMNGIVDSNPNLTIELVSEGYIPATLNGSRILSYAVTVLEKVNQLDPANPDATHILTSKKTFTLGQKPSEIDGELRWVVLDMVDRPTAPSN